MALEKTVGVDQIEVVGNGIIQVREATVITEDGKQISKTSPLLPMALAASLAN
jgi:hypothetical protein